MQTKKQLIKLPNNLHKVCPECNKNLYLFYIEHKRQKPKIATSLKITLYTIGTVCTLYTVCKLLGAFESKIYKETSSWFREIYRLITKKFHYFATWMKFKRVKNKLSSKVIRITKSLFLEQNDKKSSHITDFK